MLLEYGSIRDYNTSKGFGFLYQIMRESYHESKENVFFHIKKVKAKDRELAYELDNGRTDGVCFWFVTESTHKGEQVKELWLTANEIPDPLKVELTARIMLHWQDISSPLPLWLDHVTIAFEGQITRDRLHSERERQICDLQQTEDQKRRQGEETEAIQRMEDRYQETITEDQIYIRELEEAQYAETLVQPAVAAEQATLSLARVQPHRLRYIQLYWWCVEQEKACNSRRFRKDTEKGTLPLVDHQLQTYIAIYGGHHYYKLRAAFGTAALDQLRGSTVEIIDYGCGQAIASIIFLDYLLEQNIHIHVKRITLIDPSSAALNKGKDYLQSLLLGESHVDKYIRLHGKSLEELNDEDVTCDPQTVKIHLLSNILDVKKVDIDRLYRLIIGSNRGDNRFICTSPSYGNGPYRIDRFRHLFQYHWMSLDSVEGSSVLGRVFVFGTKGYARQYVEQYEVSRYERQFHLLL